MKNTTLLLVAIIIAATNCKKSSSSTPSTLTDAQILTKYWPHIDTATLHRASGVGDFGDYVKIHSADATIWFYDKNSIPLDHNYIHFATSALPDSSGGLATKDIYIRTSGGNLTQHYGTIGINGIGTSNRYFIVSLSDSMSTTEEDGDYIGLINP